MTEKEPTKEIEGKEVTVVKEEKKEKLPVVSEEELDELYKKDPKRHWDN